LFDYPPLSNKYYIMEDSKNAYGDKKLFSVDVTIFFYRAYNLVANKNTQEDVQ